MVAPSTKPLKFNWLSDASVTISLAFGRGSLTEGFPTITAQIWEMDVPLPQQFVGQLPAFPDLLNSLQQWQTVYLALAQRLQLGRQRQAEGMRSFDEEDDDFEIEEDAVTHVSQVSFEDLSQRLQRQLNEWLLSPGFTPIVQALRSHLSPEMPLRLILQTDDPHLHHLPWQGWQFLVDYPLAEVALSQPQFYRLKEITPQKKRQQVRILAILGSSQGIDLTAEQQQLSEIPDAEVQFLTQPTRQEFDAALWDDQGWDILFFAGHSQTEQQTGRLYLHDGPEHRSLTLEHLQEGLRTALERGLQLAIFNSCDGLGLANSLGNLQIPVTIVMREPVPNRVAQDFFQRFLEGYAIAQLPLYQAVKQARRQLQGLENDYPGAAWLPIICQNSALLPPTWLQLGGLPPCPYRGLNTFQEQDAAVYFGRESLREKLVERLQSQPLLPLVGASGSGKSSLVFAGIVPQLRQDARYNWAIQVMRPENDPVARLAHAVAMWQPDISETKLLQSFREDTQSLGTALGQIQQTQPRQTRRLLIIDQFEELFTLNHPEAQRQFLDLLVAAIQEASQFVVLLTLRADCVGPVLEHPGLGKLWQRHEPEFLLPLSRADLQAAIAQPAALMGVRFEPGLVEKIITEVQDQVGNLPLLEFALTQLWPHQETGWLTHTAYENLGGITAALRDYAEQVYGNLSADQRPQVQALFLQLIQVREGAEATRRILPQTEVKAWPLALQLASERLLTTNRDPIGNTETVEIVHEALIRHWQRLQGWIADNADFLRWQTRLNNAIEQWESHNNSDGYLLRQAPLVEAEFWLDKSPDRLSDAQRFFINLGLDLRTQEETAIALRQQRELDQERKIRRGAQKLAVLSSVALVLLGLAGGWTWWERQRSLKIIETVSINSSATTPTLLRDLPRFLTIAQRRQQTGDFDLAIAYYQKILQEITKLQARPDLAAAQQQELQSLASQTEQQLVALIQQQKLPTLETALAQGEFGSLKPETNLLDYEDQYTPGALRETYGLLLRPQGTNADLNQDGEINNPTEAQQLPCQLLQDLEALWRDHTDQQCGFYGDRSFYAAPTCAPLQGRTLTETIFVGDYEAIATQLKACQVAPESADPYE
ncbi:CHAT domain-containing protein [Picosynechococcus sp. NKBG042902]|uniref:nSTAND1 domain-containing NTPase n=1 Tax=Picosynechococcus sp. NKBG042902 TaxID=490193 RepID=UPI000A061170|nr:CHAT domain-containing protein [Picosynechococcus sp. NKBG042902]